MRSSCRSSTPRATSTTCTTSRSPTHAKQIEQPWLDQVAATHENGWKTGSRGWGYTFDRDFTRTADPPQPGDGAFRKDAHRAQRCRASTSAWCAVSATTRWMPRTSRTSTRPRASCSGEEVNLRTLLGLLKMFAEEVAMAEEVRYVPGLLPVHRAVRGGAHQASHAGLVRAGRLGDLPPRGDRAAGHQGARARVGPRASTGWRSSPWACTTSASCSPIPSKTCAPGGCS